MGARPQRVGSPGVSSQPPAPRSAFEHPRLGQRAQNRRDVPIPISTLPAAEERAPAWGYPRPSPVRRRPTTPRKSRGSRSRRRRARVRWARRDVGAA